MDTLLKETVCFVSRVNWSETVQKVRQKSKGDNNHNPSLMVESLIKVCLVKVEPVTIEDGKLAVEQREDPPVRLSLADQFCLALSRRLRIPAITADRMWGSTNLIIQIR